MCFVEYLLYYIQNVTPLPHTTGIMPKVAVIARNASNIGQQLRMELNREAEKRADWTEASLDDLLAGMQERAQLLFDRGVRYSKTVLPGTRSTHARRERPGTMRMRRVTIIEGISNSEGVLAQLPRTTEFVVFEAVARRLGVAHEHILVLWELVRKIQVLAWVFRGAGGFHLRQITRIAILGHNVPYL